MGAERGGQTHQPTDERGVRVISQVKTPETPKLPELLRIKPSRRALIVRLAKILLAAAAIAGPATHHQINYESELNLPAVGRDISSVPGFYWDLGKDTIADLLDKIQTVPETFDKNAIEQTVKAGPNGNAKAATEQQIQEFLNQVPPVFEEPKVGGYAPEIKMFLPVDLTDGSSIKIVNQLRNTKGGYNGGYFSSPDSHHSDFYSFSEPHIYIKEGGLFSLPLIAGAKTVELKVSANQYRISDIEIVYTLNDGQKLKGYLALWDNKYIPTDIFNSIPRYNPNVVKTATERDAIPGQEFDLTQNPIIPLFRASGGTTHVTLIFGNDQSGLSPTFEVDEGKVLYLPLSF